MMEDEHMSHRLLRATGTGSKTDAGPLAVLISVCVLFCIIWYVQYYETYGDTSCLNLRVCHPCAWKIFSSNVYVCVY